MRLIARKTLEYYRVVSPDLKMIATTFQATNQLFTELERILGLVLGNEAGLLFIKLPLKNAFRNFNLACWAARWVADCKVTNHAAAVHA